MPIASIVIAKGIKLFMCTNFKVNALINKESHYFKILNTEQFLNVVAIIKYNILAQ